MAEHSSATLSLARIMYGDGESWTPTQIARYLAEQGIRVHPQTVRRWVVPGVAEARRESQRLEARERRARARARGSRAEFRVLDRMRQLRDAGMACAAIAIVIRLDEGVALTREQVRYYLRVGKEPRHPKRKQRVAVAS
jgi:hypothetical protein